MKALQFGHRSPKRSPCVPPLPKCKEKRHEWINILACIDDDISTVLRERIHIYLVRDPSDPTKMTLIYILYEFTVFMAYLVREPERKLQGVVELKGVKGMTVVAKEID